MNICLLTKINLTFFKSDLDTKSSQLSKNVHLDSLKTIKVGKIAD